MSSSIQSSHRPPFETDTDRHSHKSEEEQIQGPASTSHDESSGSFVRGRNNSSSTYIDKGLKPRSLSEERSNSSIEDQQVTKGANYCVVTKISTGGKEIDIPVKTFNDLKRMGFVLEGFICKKNGSSFSVTPLSSPTELNSDKVAFDFARLRVMQGQLDSRSVAERSSPEGEEKSTIRETADEYKGRKYTMSRSQGKNHSSLTSKGEDFQSSNIFVITGTPQSGKTTFMSKMLLDKLKDLSLSFGGIFCRESRDTKGQRDGFSIIPLYESKELTSVELARVSPPLKTGYKQLNSYFVNVNNVKDVAVPAIKSARDNADVIIIDEVASMQLFCQSFVELVRDVVKGPKPVFMSVPITSRHSLVNEIKEFAINNNRLFHLDAQDRTKYQNQALSGIVKILNEQFDTCRAGEEYLINNSPVATEKDLNLEATNSV